jgi:hypothetical protein
MHHPACPQPSLSLSVLPCALFLRQVLEEQLSKLFQAASTAAAASTALSKKASSKGAAGEAATRAAAEAERVTKGLQKAAVATRDALQGRRLARGWNHLAFLMPQGALRAAQDFQQRWPGEWVGVDLCRTFSQGRFGGLGVSQGALSQLDGTLHPWQIV